MASTQDGVDEDSLYPIAVLIDELRNEDVQVSSLNIPTVLIISYYKSTREMIPEHSR